MGSVPWSVEIRWLSVLAVALAVASVACGGGDDERGGLLDPKDLRGRTVGVASLAGTATLEVRYVLQEAYDFDVDLEDGDITFREAPAESLPALVLNREVDAAIVLPQDAYRLLDADAYRVLAHATKEMTELTGGPVAGSLLVTYPDVAEQKNEAMVELNRMLGESVTYLAVNQDAVIEAVAGDQEVEPDYLRWWWERHDLLLGDLSEETQQRVVDVWGAAVAVGDIEAYPEFEDVVFSPMGEEQETPTEGDRTTISLAVIDDPNRRAALYAIEQGIVTSDSVDIDLTYLLSSAITEAAAARQYDVIEVTPLAVPLGIERELAFVVLSAALQSVDGTLLFVRDD